MFFSQRCGPYGEQHEGHLGSGKLTVTRYLPVRLTQDLVLLGPELSTVCVNLCGQVTIGACEYRCVMSLCARLPREQENLQHGLAPVPCTI